MNKIIYSGIFLVSIFLFADDKNEINVKENQFIDFPINECILKIPYGFYGGVNGDGKIMFSPGFSLHIKDFVSYQIELIEENATKVLFTRNRDLNSSPIGKIGSLNILRKINDKSEGYIVGKHFYLYSGNLDHNYTKILIENCNRTWHKDMQIENLDIISDKLMKDFPLFIDKNQSLLVKNKLEEIANNELLKH